MKSTEFVGSQQKVISKYDVFNSQHLIKRFEMSLLRENVSDEIQLKINLRWSEKFEITNNYDAISLTIFDSYMMTNYCDLSIKHD